MRFVMYVLLTATLCSCSGRTRVDTAPSPAPRPVSVITLKKSDPTPSMMVTGTVGSWKTEDIGFEVNGRVQYVIEPEKNVALPGFTRNRDESEPQILARIDPEKYRTAKESAEAQIEVLKLQKEASTIEWEQVLPEQVKAAKAAQGLAIAEFERGEELIGKNAISRSEYDRYVAIRDAKTAEVAQLRATLAEKEAKIKSLDAEIKQAEAALQDAVRDLKDCEISAPFAGQIASVHVMRGGTVERGEPVVTLQMMDPVKIEFQVSAERVRQLRYKDPINVRLIRPDLIGSDGTAPSKEAVIWNTGTAADTSTRTFTITVLIRNRLVATEVPDGVDSTKLVRTRDIWAFVRGIMGNPDHDYIEQNAIQKDEVGEFVWKIIDDDVAERSRGPLLKVEKVRVTTEDEEADFLGLWKFLPVSIVEGEEFDPEFDRVLGKLVFPDGAPKKLVDNTVLFEREQWMLRPGDLVGVDLSETPMPPGFYVPIDAIAEESGKNYVFALVPEEAPSKVRRVEVTVSEGPNTLKRIEAVGDQPLSPGTQIVLGGVHYLIHDEPVNVVSEMEAN